MLTFTGPAQPSPALGDGTYLKVKCLGCETVALDCRAAAEEYSDHEKERIGSRPEWASFAPRAKSPRAGNKCSEVELAATFTRENGGCNLSSTI